MKKIKNKNKKIDIEAEFIGKPVCPKAIKEKKNDLTDEIKEFIKNPIDFDSIKNILLRLNGRISCKEKDLYKMKIFSFENNTEFFITIKQSIYFTERYYISNHMFCQIPWHGRKEIYESQLKQQLGYYIYDWIRENLNHTINIE